MAKRSCRRSVSIKDTTYRRLEELARLRDLSGSGLLEELIAREAAASGVREFDRAEVQAARKRKPKPEPLEIASAYFTF